MTKSGNSICLGSKCWDCLVGVMWIEAKWLNCQGQCLWTKCGLSSDLWVEVLTTKCESVWVSHLQEYRVRQDGEALVPMLGLMPSIEEIAIQIYLSPSMCKQEKLYKHAVKRDDIKARVDGVNHHQEPDLPDLIVNFLTFKILINIYCLFHAIHSILL